MVVSVALAAWRSSQGPRTSAGLELSRGPGPATRAASFSSSRRQVDRYRARRWASWPPTVRRRGPGNGRSGRATASRDAVTRP